METELEDRSFTLRALAEKISSLAKDQKSMADVSYDHRAEECCHGGLLRVWGHFIALQIFIRAQRELC